ncbi:MAG TPA: hypothetical protein PLL69_06610 [Gemmatimonadales bacterium]|nr:hypothetical protein [Gemmatimonadales bacterium]
MRSVLFVDPPAFRIAVETLCDSALRHRPVAVAPAGADRALLLALNAEAVRAGLSRGMPVTLARRHCPDLIVLPPNPRRYAAAHRALHEILARYAPVIEPRGYGQCYLDLTGTARLFGPPVDAARLIGREVASRLGLRLAVGVAVNKLVSETAAQVAKQERGAEILPVARGEEASFLSPQPVDRLPEVPDRIRQRLHDYHLERIGQVAAVGAQPLGHVFGRAGTALHRHSCGVDDRPVVPPAVRAELRTSHVLASDTNDGNELDRVINALALRLGRRLRARNLSTRQLTVTLRHSDDQHATRTVAVAATALDAELAAAARRALQLARSRRVTVRALSLDATQLTGQHEQLELWRGTARPRAAALQDAIDRIGAVLQS